MYVMVLFNVLIFHQQFKAAAEDVKKLSKDPGNDNKLAVYALYKQGTVGDCNTCKRFILLLGLFKLSHLITGTYVRGSEKSIEMSENWKFELWHDL